MHSDPAGTGQNTPHGKCNAQPKQSGAHRMPIYGVLSAQHGKEIIQLDGRCGIGFFRNAAMHQVGKCQSQRICQRFQCVDIRQTDAPLPAADSLVGNVQLFRQFSLCQPLRFAHPAQIISESSGIHFINSLGKKHSIRQNKTQSTLCLPGQKPTLLPQYKKQNGAGCKYGQRFPQIMSKDRPYGYREEPRRFIFGNKMPV